MSEHATDREAAAEWPTKLRAELLAGGTVRAAARSAGVSERTAFRWLTAHRDELAVAMLRSSGVGRFIGRLAGGVR